MFHRFYTKHKSVKEGRDYRDKGKDTLLFYGGGGGQGAAGVFIISTINAEE